MATKEELWQGVDEKGNFTHALSKVACANGALHGASHIWIWRKNADGAIHVLLQKRSDTMLTWPGYLTCSAAGHIDHGESPLEAALRETSEEIGAAFRSEQLTLLFTHHFEKRISPAIFENEVQWVYGVNIHEDLRLHPQRSEVSKLIWMPLDEVKLLAHNKHIERLVPHGDEYHRKVIAAIETSFKKA